MLDRDRPTDRPSGAVPAGYRPQSADTSLWAERRLFGHLRTLGPRETAAMIGAACRMMDEVLLAGLRRDHPGESEETLALRAYEQHVTNISVIEALAD